MRVTNAGLHCARVWLLLAAAISFSGVGYAGPGIWMSGGPYGGVVGPLTIDPVNPATLYAAGGADGVFKSTDSGATWSAANTGLPSLRAHSSAIHRASPATLYAGTGDGIFKSADSGTTWFPSSRGITFST